MHLKVQSSSRFRKANSSLWALHPHIGLSCFTVWNNVANQINTSHFSLAICYKIDSLPLKAYNLYYAYNPCQYTNHTFKIRLQNGEPTKTTNLVTSSNKQVVTCNVLWQLTPVLKIKLQLWTLTLKTYCLQMARVHTEDKAEVENLSNF